jgi:beta-glucanase (GH16 family)
MTWTPDAIRFEVDGERYYEVTKAMVEEHGRWVFDTPKHLIVNLALGGAYPRAVNQVAAPYVGLPAATVDLIRQDDVKMLVDWVRITAATTVRRTIRPD